MVATIPNNPAGINNFTKDVPHAFIAVISLSDDKRPNAIRVDTRIAMGTASAKIQAIFNNTNSKNKPISSPLPKNLSILLIKKFARSTKNKITRDIINGTRCSLNIYLLMIFIK